MKALLIGGNGPTGPMILDGLLSRGADATVLNRGSRASRRHGAFERITADPYFADSLGAALRGRTFDVVVATYGRLQLMPPILARCTERVVTVGGTAYAGTGGVPAREDSPRDRTNGIIDRLVAAEGALTTAHVAGLFSHTHLRYPLLWGPGQLAPKEWSVIRRVLDGRPFVPMVDGGRTIETKCFVDNAAQAVLLAVDDPATSGGQTYNVGDAVNPDDASRVRHLCAALGAPDVALLELPRAATGPAGFWAIGRDLDYVREGRPPRTDHLVVDTSKIRRELGFRDVLAYEEAVARTAAFYVDNPLPAGGVDEAKIGDPFDYAGENGYAALLESFVAAAAAIPFAGTTYRHQYDHPKR